MFTVVCGEDMVGSREYFVKLKQEYKNKNFEIADLQFGELLDLEKWQAANLSLFAEKKAFFCENINRKINRRSFQQTKLLDNIIKDSDLTIISWEEGVSSRDLKFGKSVKVKEFKPSQTIFKLTDSCYPGNLTGFIRCLEELPAKVSDGFIFYMLVKQLRNLLLVKSELKPAKMFDWQIWKLQKQAKFWSLDKLLTFYDGLHRIDILEKTSKNPFGLRRSFDILAYYIL